MICLFVLDGSLTSKISSAMVQTFSLLFGPRGETLTSQ